jgi:bifunctional pyridoxal-dependent enzyme with beta-cystathionase and maltose regulon repressor activities
LHIYEEVAQHHGQLQVLRDVLLAARTAPVGFDDLPIDWLRAKQSVKWHRPGPQLLPAWVADMDFPVAAPISAAIERTVRAGDLGYPDWPNHPLAEPFSHRMHDRYGWQPEPGHVRGVTDLIQALQIVLTLATDPGDGVIAHVPNYPPFLATVERMGRTLIPAQLTPDGDASWSWDHERLTAQLTGGRPRVLLLVNPHNPTGRVFSRDELQLLADCAERHDLVVVSDEIHAELAHRPYQHVPFASLSPSAAARTVTVTSATKAFNIAGLRTAVAHVGPAELRARWDDQPPDLFGGAGVLGVEATKAAWAESGSWLAALNDHLLGQRDHLTDRLAELPMLRLRPPQASYLAWLDCTAAELPLEPAQWFRERAGVELSAGVDFGPGGAGHARLNFATSRAVLDELVDRIAASLRG